MTQLSISQDVAAITETEFAIRNICDGLRELNRLDAANNQPEIALQLLAQGFERLAKLVLILAYLEHEGRLMSKSDLRWYGHRVDQLLSRVIELSESADYAQSEDLRFLKNDPRLTKLVAVIADFGDQGRYHSLNILVGATPDDGPPIEAFEDVKFEILDSHPKWKEKLGSGKFSGFYPVLLGDLTEVFQRCASALCRMFILELFGQRGKRLTGIIQSFLFLGDDDLRTVAARCSERYPQ